MITLLILFFTFNYCDKKNTINIGATAFLTGQLANTGSSIKNGLLLGVDEINHNGGINGKQINLILEDEGDNPRQATSAVRKLIEIDKVPIIIGPISSSSVMAVAPIANKNKVVILSPGAGSPNITNAGDYIFRNRATGSLEAIEIAQYALMKMNLKNIIIFEINEDYGRGFREVFRKYIQNNGGKILFVDSYNQGDTNFGTQLVKFKNYKYDAIYIIGVPREVGLILKQAKELGINTVFLMNNMENNELLEIAGNAAEGIFFSIPYFDQNSYNKYVREFVNNYKYKYGNIPDLFAANGYDAIYIVKNAIERSRYNGEKIRDALYSLRDFEVVNGGRISFDENGDVIKKLVIKTVINNQFKVVERED